MRRSSLPETEITSAVRPVTRRNFFKLLGGGVAVALTYSELYTLAAPLRPEEGAFKGGQESYPPDENTIAAWIHIQENGTVSVFTGKVEVGQNIRTSLAQAVAEELAVPLSAIEMTMGDTLLTPYDRGTYGSLTTPQMAPVLRRAAASMKAALIDMAAAELGVDKAELKAGDGKLRHSATGKSLDYGALTGGKKIMLPVDERAELTPPERWVISGTPAPKVGAVDFVTGKHKYASDMSLPGMLWGKVLRPPANGASLLSADLEQARSITGAELVEEGDFIAAVAPDPQTAAQAVARIEARWERTPQPSREHIFTYLKEHSRERDSDPSGLETVRKALAASAVQLEHQFEVQYIAHVPLEPRAALATWDDGQLTVWTGTQRPFGVQEELMRAFDIPAEKVRVFMPDTGSAFGGKHSGEAALEAARLSKAVGKPVKIVWTREEEFKWAYLRPAGLIEVRAGAGSDGRVASWEFHNYNSGGAGIETPYETGNSYIRFHPSDSPLKQGSYRALASTANIFAIESMMDDLALELKTDPLAFRLNNLKEERLRDVLEAAARRFGWKENKKTEGHGYGLACGMVKGGYTATCAEIVYDEVSGQLRVLRAVVAFECGAIVNPRHLEDQVTGAVLQGIGGALFEEIDFAEGRILNPSLATYRVPRFADVPQLEAVLLDRKDLPSAGAGEAPIVGIAPAIRNAILSATGIKLYNLPLIPRGLKEHLTAASTDKSASD